MLTVDQLVMFGDRLLVDPDERLVTSEGGLHIPQTVLRDNPNYFGMTGIVLKLGDGVMRHTWQCINCLVFSPIDDGPCPGCHQPLGNSNARLFEADTDRHAFDVQIGDRVLFNRFAGKQVKLIDRRYLGPPATYEEVMRATDLPKTFLIMREPEIIGVVEGDHRILPGYQAPKWGKVTEGLTV